jgi:putative ABC transport system substrate-binding protein
MDRRTFLLAGVGALGTLPQIAQRQPSGTAATMVIGILGNEPSSSVRTSFGVAESSKLAVEIETVTSATAYASRIRVVTLPATDAASLSAQAPLLLGQTPAVIIAVGTPATIAAARAMPGVPIVMVGVADPVALRLVQSLPRPGRNITGISLLGPEMLEKSLDLLQEAVPAIKRPAVLWNSSNPGAALSLRHMQLVAVAKGLNFVSVPVERSAQLDGALADLTQLQHDAVILISDPVFVHESDTLLTYCSAHRLPSLFSTASWVVRGGLMSYEPQAVHMYRRGANYVLRILEETKPAGLPVEQPTLFSFAVNMKTAKALGLTIPQSLLLRADEVIE